MLTRIGVRPRNTIQTLVKKNAVFIDRKTRRQLGSTNPLPTSKNLLRVSFHCKDAEKCERRQQVIGFQSERHRICTLAHTTNYYYHGGWHGTNI